MSDSVRPHRWQPTKLHHPWDSPGKNTGVGCYFLLQCKKWKWSHSVMSNSSRAHGLQPSRLLRPWDFPDKSTGVGCHCLLHPGGTVVKNSPANAGDIGSVLAREDFTCCGASKPVRLNYWTSMLQLLKPMFLEPVLWNKRSQCNEKPTHCKERKSTCSNEDSGQPKISKWINNLGKTKEPYAQNQRQCWVVRHFHLQK